jgi:predicted adenylyl cyclase CyaB
MKAKINTKSTFLNIEAKARCADLQRVREFLNKHGAESKGTDHQVDTYFKVANGRLKLREGKIENHLIQYERVNKHGPKQSKVLLYKSEPNSSLKAVLAKALGVLAVVDKHREIYFIENVKFHLDRVKGLGSFVEIEAIDFSGKIGLVKLNKQCEYYLKALKIPQQDLLPNSYSDLILVS